MHHFFRHSNAWIFSKLQIFKHSNALSRHKSIEILKFQNKFQVNILNSSQNESQIKTKKVKLEREQSHLANWLQKKSKTVFPKYIISFPKYRTSFLNTVLHFKNADLHLLNADLHLLNAELHFLNVELHFSNTDLQCENAELKSNSEGIQKISKAFLKFHE